MVAINSGSNPGKAQSRLNFFYGLAAGCLILVGFTALACKRTPDANQNVKAGKGPSGIDVPTEQLKLNEGTKIALIQNYPMVGGAQVRMLAGIQRNLEIQTPVSSEGMTFRWELKWEGQSPVAAAPGSPESQPTVEPPAQESYREEGTMTLADMVQPKIMTLPIFWPAGELYLSNSAAIWLSDRSFQDLKKNKVSEWNLGLLGSSLWGAVPTAAIFEQLINKFEKSLENQPEKLVAFREIKLLDKSDAYRLKINGREQEVDTFIAGNWLAQYRVLNNTLNPLILEVRLMPEASLSEIFFSPIAPVKALLEYHVDSIDLPGGAPKLGQSL